LQRIFLCPTPEGVIMEQRGRFDGREAKIYRSGGMINVYYGGRYDNAPNDGHGHVKATGGPHGENIVFWRLPEDEGGEVIIDNRFTVTNGNDVRLDVYLTEIF